MVPPHPWHVPANGPPSAAGGRSLKVAVCDPDWSRVPAGCAQGRGELVGGGFCCPRPWASETAYPDLSRFSAGWAGRAGGGATARTGLGWVGREGRCCAATPLVDRRRQGRPVLTADEFRLCGMEVSLLSQGTISVPWTHGPGCSRDMARRVETPKPTCLPWSILSANGHCGSRRSFFVSAREEGRKISEKPIP